MLLTLHSIQNCVDVADVRSGKFKNAIVKIAQRICAIEAMWKVHLPNAITMMPNQNIKFSAIRKNHAKCKIAVTDTVCADIPFLT
jgi:hypothetical protein